MIALLNLVAKCGLQTELRESLQSLHASLENLDLYGTEFSRATAGDAIDWNTAVRRAQSRSKQDRFAYEEDRLVKQIVYLQSGLLIGSGLRTLVGRFQRKQAADINLIVERALDELQSSETHFYKKEALLLLDRHLSERDKLATRSIPVLSDLLVSQPEWCSLGKTLTVLSRIAGDQYVAHLAKAFEMTDDPKRDALLHACVFYGFPALRCDVPASMKEFLRWTDSVFSSTANEDLPVQLAVANLMRSLLRDRSKMVIRQKEGTDPRVTPGLISQSCQRMILDHLMSYSQLTDENFWLASAIARSDQPLIPIMDRLFRQTVLERSLAALSEPTHHQEADRLHAHALMIIRNVTAAGDELAGQQRSTVLKFLTGLIRSAAVDLKSKSDFHDLFGPFDRLPEPVVPNSRNDGNMASNCNSLIAGLNLIHELNLADELSDPIESLHETAGRPRIKINFYSSFRHWSDRYESVQRIPGGSVTELFTQTVFLQTGILLGKDPAELLSKPTRLKREEEEARKRFVQPGDTLAIHIPGLLPADNAPPPVIQAGQRSPVTGFPVPVNAEGEIRLPLLDALPVKGKELKEIRERLIETYVDMSIVNPTSGGSITVQFLMRAGEQFELRNIIGVPNFGSDVESEP